MYIVKTDITINGKLRKGIVEEYKAVSEEAFINRIHFEYENEWYIPNAYMDLEYLESLPVEEQARLNAVERYVLLNDPFTIDPGADLAEYTENEYYLYCKEWLKQVYYTAYHSNKMDENIQFIFDAVYFGNAAFKEYSRFENLNSIELREYVQADLIDWMKTDIADEWEEGGEEDWDENNYIPFVK